MSNINESEEFLPSNSNLNKYKPMDKDRRYQTYTTLVESLTYIFTQSSADIKRHCIKTTAILSTEYLDVLNQSPSLALTLSNKINDLIINHDMRELILVYNVIYADGKYDQLEIPTVTIPKEVTDNILTNYKLQEPIAKQHAKPKYAIGEIIGAKDKESNWWMSEVLYCASYNTHTIYYIKFLNWGEQFNEFIHEKHRMQKFNPYKHKYYRSASELASIYSESD